MVRKITKRSSRTQKAGYVDGFVLTVPKKKVEAYCKMAQKAGKIWKEYGAIEFRECQAQDLKIPMGVPFTKIMKPKPNETIFFSWITYKSKADRDRINKKVMKDPRVHEMCDPKDMPVDCNRMTYGGFKIMVNFDKDD